MASAATPRDIEPMTAMDFVTPCFTDEVGNPFLPVAVAPAVDPGTGCVGSTLVMRQLIPANER